jgi:serine protease Do
MRRLVAGAVFVLLAGLLLAFDRPDVVLPRDRADNVGRLGMSVLPLARQTARIFAKSPPQRGAVVVSVERFGPAGTAGVRVGDIIVRLNGLEIHDGSELARHTMTARTGSIAVVEFLRNGQLHQAPLTVGKPPANKIYV